MSEIVTPLVYQLGIGAVGGFICGYIFKILSKLLIVLIGLFLIALVYLSTQGIININYQALWDAAKGLVGSAEQAAGWLVGLISVLPFIGSFLVGFLIGFKLG
jgi:uncharacterized membrane protein (Fun14 family)